MNSNLIKVVPIMVVALGLAACGSNDNAAEGPATVQAKKLNMAFEGDCGAGNPVAAFASEADITGCSLSAEQEARLREIGPLAVSANCATKGIEIHNAAGEITGKGSFSDDGAFSIPLAVAGNYGVLGGCAVGWEATATGRVVCEGEKLVSTEVTTAYTVGSAPAAAVASLAVEEAVVSGEREEERHRRPDGKGGQEFGKQELGKGEQALGKQELGKGEQAVGKQELGKGGKGGQQVILGAGQEGKGGKGGQEGKGEQALGKQELGKGGPGQQDPTLAALEGERDRHRDGDGKGGQELGKGQQALGKQELGKGEQALGKQELGKVPGGQEPVAALGDRERHRDGDGKGGQELGKGGQEGKGQQALGKQELGKGQQQGYQGPGQDFPDARVGACVNFVPCGFTASAVLSCQAQ